MTAVARPDRSLLAYRDDGIVAQSLGRFVDGQLPPLLPAIAGVTVTVILSGVGVAHLRRDDGARPCGGDGARWTRLRPSARRPPRLARAAATTGR